MLHSIPEKTDIMEVHKRISGFIHRTPILTSKSIDQIAGCEIKFKCENFQKIGAFKVRGAVNATLSLSQKQRRNGIATHSSGNHAQAIAYAASICNIKAFIVMPKNAPEIKINAVRGYGAKIFFCEPTLKAREDTIEKVIAETSAYFIHPYNDYNVIAGQATASLEMYNLFSDLDFVITPVGGGGLLSGTILSTQYFAPYTQVLAGEPAGADDAYQSLKKGSIVPSVNPDTIADGLLTSLGDKTFEIIRKNVTDIILVSDEEIVEAMRLIWERMKIIVEPSGAVPLAAILKEKKKYTGRKIGIILSGGNIDLSKKYFK